MPGDNEFFGSKPDTNTSSRLVGNRLSFQKPVETFGTSKKDEYKLGMQTESGLKLLNILYAQKNKNSTIAYKKILTLIDEKFSRNDADWLSGQLSLKDSDDEYTKTLREKFSERILKKVVLALGKKSAGAFRKEAAMFELNAAEKEKKENAVMAIALHDAFTANSNFKFPNTSMLAYFNPVDDNTLEQQVNDFLDSFILLMEYEDFDRLVYKIKLYRIFLQHWSFKSVLHLFQILKYVRKSFEKDLLLPQHAILMEVYLETYMGIIRTAKANGSLQYQKDIPPEDRIFFEEALLHKAWDKYKSGYIGRIQYSCAHMSDSMKMTELMFYVHILASKKNILLVNQDEGRVIFEAFQNMSREDMESRVITPEFGYSSITSPVKMGSYLDGMHVFYISAFNEFPKVGFGSQIIYLKHPKIDFFLFEVSFETLGERQLKTFMEHLYNRVKHIIPLMQAYFKVMAYLPVLIYAGPAVLLKELIINEYVAPKIAKQVAKIDPILETPAEIISAAALSVPNLSKIPGTIARKLPSIENKALELAMERAGKAVFLPVKPAAFGRVRGKITIMHGTSEKSRIFIEENGFKIDAGNIANSDLSKGVYFALEEDVALVAAQRKTAGKREIMAFELDGNGDYISKIVDVRTKGMHGELWEKYLQEEIIPPMPGKKITNADIIRSNVEQRGPKFEEFLKKNNLDDADLVFANLGDDFTNGAVTITDGAGNALVRTQVVVRSNRALEQVNLQLREANARAVMQGAKQTATRQVGAAINRLRQIAIPPKKWSAAQIEESMKRALPYEKWSQAEKDAEKIYMKVFKETNGDFGKAGTAFHDALNAAKHGADIDRLGFQTEIKTTMFRQPGKVAEVASGASKQSVGYADDFATMNPEGLVKGRIVQVYLMGRKPMRITLY